MTIEDPEQSTQGLTLEEDNSIKNLILFAVFCYVCVEIYNLLHADVHRAVTNCKIES